MTTASTAPTECTSRLSAPRSISQERSTYLPDFTVHSAFEEHPERKITLRMLLVKVDNIRGLMAPPPPGSLDIYPVSTAVNNVRNNGPELIEPVPAER